MEGDGGEEGEVEGGEDDGVRGCRKGIGEAGEYAVINRRGLGASEEEG